MTNMQQNASPLVGCVVEARLLFPRQRTTLAGALFWETPSQSSCRFDAASSSSPWPQGTCRIVTNQR